MEQLRPIQRVAPPTPVDRREPHHREEQEGEPGEQAARPAAQAERADSPSVLVEGRAARLAGEADASDPLRTRPAFDIYGPYRDGAGVQQAGGTFDERHGPTYRAYEDQHGVTTATDAHTGVLRLR